LTAIRSNFAGMPQALATAGLPAADLILLDLGVSSMQIDNPERGFSYKSSGPLDMRMNPQRGQPASAWLKSASAQLLAEILTENADEPHAIVLADALAGQSIPSTDALAAAVRRIVPAADAEKSLMRVFQAIRIAVNDELGALDSFLRVLPACLAPGGRIAILTFHSGEDRRVKKAFEANLATGFFSHVADLQRPGPEEVRANPRAAPAKLRAATRPSL
jgi:16S rRNA (cytosine1402-N4)-methyltransferase